MLTLLVAYQILPALAAENEKEIIAGVPANFPPQYHIEAKTGIPVGFAIDIMNEVAQRSGVKVRYVVYPTWAKTIEAMEKGEVVLIPNIGIIAERVKQMDFTSPVETSDIVVFVRETTTDIKGIEDLKGKEVAVVEMNKGQYLMQERGGSRLQIYVSQEEAFLSLLSGKSDALVYPESPIKLLLQQTGLEDHIKIVGEPLLEVKRGIAVRKGNHELLKKLDDEVKTFIKSPRYEKIYAKWYGKPALYWTARRVAVFFGGVLAIAIVTLLIWRYLSVLRLNRELQAALTERKKSEEALRESEARLKEAQQIAHLGHWELDLVEHTLYWSDEVYRIFGLEPQEFGATYEAFLEHVYPDDRDFVNRAYTESVRSRTGYDIGHRVLLKNGEVKYVRERCQTEYDERGNPLRSIGTVSDITQLKLAEEALRKLNEELEMRVRGRTAELKEKAEELEQANIRLKELDRLKSMFIASMSHELRTPLNSIIGFSSILLNEWLGSLTAEQKENLSIILRSGKHLLNLIDDVIDVSKVEAGIVETRIEDFDIYDVISEAVTTFAKDIKEKGLELKVEMVHQQMHTDRRRLLQCVLNLISNAVKFTGKGSITVQILIREPERIDVEEGKTSIEISVTDTGIGIEEENIPKLFNAFVRLESPLKAKVPGTGLGLYLIKKLVTEVLKGEIMVESEEGKRSKFTIKVPVRVDEKGSGNRG